MKADYKQAPVPTLSRRKFLKVSVAAGAGLTIGIYLSRMPAFTHAHADTNLSAGASGHPGTESNSRRGQPA